jgi:hypothetical protein
MARPVSWLPRLVAIQRAVAESVRSHYTSSEIERLFEIQPRSAQMLLNLLPTVRVGKSLLVEREALEEFLTRLAGAADPALELAAVRAQGKPPIVRRKLRELVQQDVDASLTSLPPNVVIEPGILGIRFSTIEELAASLWRLAQILEEDLDGFAERYEPAVEIDLVEKEAHDLERADVLWIREWLAEHA